MTAATTQPRAGAALFATLRTLWPSLLAVAIVASAFVVLVPPGLPYDEPSHWLNVLWWLEHWSMPVIGDPGTSYEAQMGPVAYALYAFIAWPFQALWGDEAAFYAARASGVVQLLAFALVVALAARRALNPRKGVLVLVVLAVGLNPMLLAVSTSIQNDTLSLLLGGAALLVSLGPTRRPGWNAALAGALLGLAILTKVTIWPIAVGIAVALLLKRRLFPLAVVTATALAVSGWWFVRNLSLYGDLTGRAGVDAAGYDFPALDASVGALARQVVTYLWLPTEYVRNAVESPPVIDIVVILLTVLAMAGLVLFAVHRRRGAPTVVAIVVTAVVALVAWVVLVEFTQSIAFRTAYPALLALYAGVGALAFMGARRALVAVLVPLGIVGVWFLVAVAGLDPLMSF